MLHTRYDQPRWGIWHWFFGIAILALVFALAILLRPSRNQRFLHDSRFIVTTRPAVGPPSNPSLLERAFTWWLKARQRFSKPDPLAYSFPAGPTKACSIHGLLNQCTELTGVQYVIAKDVAAGSIQFGHSNTLNGAQWVAAVTEALQSGQPEWWDSQLRRFRRENLVLVTNDVRTVLVLPRTMVHEFQSRRAD